MRTCLKAFNTIQPRARLCEGFLQALALWKISLDSGLLNQPSGSAPDDWTLYAQFKSGDPEAFRQLFHRYKNRIFRLAYRFVRNAAVAEDIAQNVLIKIYEKKAEHQSRAKFSTWVYRVTANASLGHLRKGKFLAFSLNEFDASGMESARSAVEGIGGERAPSASEDLETRERETWVARAVETLPEDLRVVMVLFSFEEKSYQEIAAILGISSKAVERRIYRAKEILREKLVGKFL